MSVDIKTLKKNQKENKLKPSGFSLWLDEWKNREISLFNSFGDKQKERFFSAVGMLLSAGIDLQTIMEISLEETSSKNSLNNIYQKILRNLVGGTSLANAMENTGVFNNFDCFSVLIGENTGELAGVFQQLALYYKKRIAQKRKIAAALTYPVIVLISTVGAVYFMLKFVVPMFSQTLVRFGGELPPLTKFIIAVSKNISTYLVCITIVVGFVLFAFRKTRNKTSTRKFVAEILRRIPYLGKMIYKSHLVQFTQSMSLLLNAKINIVDSINLTKKMVNFYPLQSALERVSKDLSKGEFVYKSMERQKFFDQTMIRLIRIGEEINQLDKIFIQLSKQYEDDLDHHTSLLISVLEPLMLLILAVLVAIILIAMYLPMFKIGTIIH